MVKPQYCYEALESIVFWRTKQRLWQKFNITITLKERKILLFVN